jgi:hypothetical protein
VSLRRARLLALLAILGACGAPVPHLDAGVPDGGALDAGDGGPGRDAGETRCVPLPGDYTPRIAMSSTDDWPPCISDLGAYVRIEPSISTVARVEAFDALFAPGGLLAGDARDPTPADFTSARALYETDQGLGSRVVRRSDEHLPAPASSDCRLGEVVAASPEYCGGPTQLAPIAREAFAAGMIGSGDAGRVLAARIEAALLWFLHLSHYKESLTCTVTARDCDSAWAYYTGGAEVRSEGLGLARLVRSLDPEAHERMWDALLAVRCWRDLDPEPVASARLDLRERARDQLDRAAERVMVALIVDRLRRFQAADGLTREAHLAWLRVLLAPLPARLIPSPDPGGADIAVPARASLADRMLRARSPALADRVATELAAGDGGELDVDALVATLESLFPCA